MEIRMVSFESKLTMTINTQLVEVTPFMLPNDMGNIKLGINAPKSMAINREEIFKQKASKLITK